MDPIDASNTWRWFGYGNSWVVLDGTLMQSVKGGGTSSLSDLTRRGCVR
jgi:phage protein U